MFFEIGRRVGVLVIVGIIKVDFYEKGMNFVFGVVSEKLRSVVVLIYWLRFEFYGRLSNDEFFIERIVKEVMYEFGYVFGFFYCLNVCCVMYFLNLVDDMDIKFFYYCLNCEWKFLRNLEVVL